MSDEHNAIQLVEQVPDDGFLALVQEPETLTTIIRENIGTDAIRVHDLQRIGFPTGKAGAKPKFTVPSFDGESEVEAIEGVIIFSKKARYYYAASYDESPGQPPACYSVAIDAGDGATFTELGIGEPGGECANCPLAKFGPNREKPPCAEKRAVFLLMKDALLPVQMLVPPTGLKALRQYMFNLSTHIVPYHGVVTRFTLEKAANSAGLEYARLATPTAVRRLNNDEKARVGTIIRELRPWLLQINVTDDMPAVDAEVEDGGSPF